MPSVTILPFTPKEPISMIGFCAAVCQFSKNNPERDFKRGLECIEANHGRTLEYPEIYAVLDGYSARVIREWYTHIGCLPTRLQASTRYINYDNFAYVTPPSVENDEDAVQTYQSAMNDIMTAYEKLQDIGVPKEDAAMVLPLGMTTRVVDKRNLRNVADMSHQRMCSRAYHEYRKLFHDYITALSEYSEEWAMLVKMLMKPKCEVFGYCPEKNSCGRKPQKTVA
ncbi:MAG: FAD-dependent thymidylate synthase [Anaerolineaceae bacterium]|nr:FAD-dependent thymidylate synthase [Anaerolineaceae bacterium]